jgi:oxygen-independent coproporphyrinogen-3 oxidase
VANNAKYMAEGHLLAEKEELNPADQLNEYLMVRLRTKWGIDLNYVRESFEKIGHPYPEKEFHTWISQGFARIENDFLMLEGEGKLIADRLSSDIFVV